HRHVTTAHSAFSLHDALPIFLQELGLSCRPVLARVYANPDKPTAGGLTHQSTIVEIGGEDFIVDPGFGGGTPTVAVPLREAARRSEEHTSELQSSFDIVCLIL